jgi:hypothetical protein
MSCRIWSIFQVAGVGIVATITWLAGDGNWVTAADWGLPTVPGPSDDAAISASGSYFVSITTRISVGSINVVSDSGALLSILDPAGSESVAGDLSNSGGVFPDNTGGEGTTLIIGGTLTNSNQLQVGNVGLSSATTLSQRMLERRASCANAPCATL